MYLKLTEESGKIPSWRGTHFDIKVLQDCRGEKLTITLEKNLDYMLGLRSETEASGWDFAQGRGGGGQGG